MLNFNLNRRKLLALSAALAATATTPAMAQSPRTLKFVTISRNIPPWVLFEAFKKEVEEKSDGELGVDLTTTTDLGVQSSDIIRLLQTGLVDIGNVVPLHVSGSLPLIEATELPGIFPDVETNRKAFEAWTEQVLMEESAQIGGRIIGSFGWAGQMLFSRVPINDLDDLKGAKIRVTSRSMSDYVTALGGQPVTISLDELFTGLQQGAVDGATTAAATGYQQNLWESTKYLVDLNIGTPTGIIVVASSVWDSLSPELQQVLIDAGARLTKDGWDQSLSLEKVGIDQNAEKGVQYFPTNPDWKPRLKQAQEEVARKWAERAGEDAKATFNEVLSPYTQFTID